MPNTSIIKYDIYGDEVAEFDVGELVELEDFPPDKVNTEYWSWPGTRRAIIVETYDYDGDADDYGRSISIPARADVAIVPKNGETFIERIDISDLYKVNELYGKTEGKTN